MLQLHEYSFHADTNGLCIKAPDHCYQTAFPVALHVLDNNQFRRNVRGGYCACEETPEGVRCTARLSSPSGSRFCVTDLWRADEKMGSFVLRREVRVESSSGGDLGFGTEFMLPQDRCETLQACEVFIPGVWYRHNEGVVSTAFAASMNDKNYLIRQTRAALPYVQLCDAADGSSLTLCALAPAPSTGVRETNSRTLVDASLQYGAIGIDAGGRPGVRFCFPGSEGEINYLDSLTPTADWAWRYHPVCADVPHAYSVAIHLQGSQDLHGAMRNEWRHWFACFDPQVHPADLERVYEIGADLLNVYCQPYNGAMGLPFWATVPEGTVCDLSFQMGFVGQQPMCAYHLMRSGVKQNDPERIQKAMGIIQFWVDRSCEDGVLPRVWYDVFPPRFKQDYPTYTRTVTDGMEGILLCYQYLKRERGTAPAEWLAFVERYGDWLTTHQNGDGSFYRAYTPDGTPVHEGKFNTSNTIRLLCNLFWQTGKASYREAALRAGEYCYQSCYQPIRYIGGTADNDNTIDKEAGMLALYAFMALYDLTGEERWVRAAQGAADFIETWTYSWAFEVKPAKGNAVFHKADITGLSLIATGHSHSDVMMGYCPFDFYRLYLLTEDAHYLTFARFLLHNTKQTTDWSGQLGHVYPGLVEESGEVAKQYHNGLGRWLPWCTIAEIEALSRLEEWFGSADIDVLESRHAQSIAQNHAPGSSFIALRSIV